MDNFWQEPQLMAYMNSWLVVFGGEGRKDPAGRLNNQDGWTANRARYSRGLDTQESETTRKSGQPRKLGN